LSVPGEQMRADVDDGRGSEKDAVPFGSVIAKVCVPSRGLRRTAEPA
jgi:hypothetical protein